MTLRPHFAALLIASSLLAFGSVAEAQDDGQVVFVEDSGQGQPVAQQQPLEDPQQQRGLFQSGASLDIPIFVTDTDLLLPGVGVRGRWAVEFGYIVPEVEVGFQIMGLDGHPTSDFHTNLWASGGLRIQFLNASSILPYVSANANFNFFSLQSSDVYNFILGIGAAGGATIELSEQLGIDVGVEVRALMPLFDHFGGEFELMVLPKAGFTYFYG